VPVGAVSYEVRLAPEMTIEGTVVDPGGRGIRGVRVKADTYDLEHLGSHEPWVCFVPTDEEGRFRIASIGQGKYRISVDAPPSFAPSPPVETIAGARDLRIVLLEGLVRTPVVTDPNGRPVARALVTAKAENRGTVYADSDRDGRARLEGLDAEGQYVLVVQPPFDRMDLLPFRLAEWTPSNDPVRLSRAYSIDGYVRDAEGRFVVGAQVSAEDARGRDFRERTDAQGRFVFDRLPEGEVTLLAQQESPPRTGRKTKCRAGTHGVVLTLDATATIRLRLVSPLPFGDEETIELIDEETGEATGDASVAADGRVEVPGVHPKATYTLHHVHQVQGDGPNLVAFRTGLRVGEGRGRPLEPGLAIDGRWWGCGGRLRGRRGAVRPRRGAPEPPGGRGGRFRITGLAAGPWRSSPSFATGARGQAEVEAGSTVEIRVGRRDERRPPRCAGAAMTYAGVSIAGVRRRSR
jgi:hypothetical protein